MENKRPSEMTTNNRVGEGDVDEEAIVQPLPEHREVNIRSLSPTELFSGDEKGNIDISNLLALDKDNPKYKKVLKVAEGIVDKSDAESLVHLVHDGIIHSTVLLRLFEKYAEKTTDSKDNFIKLADALTELEVLNYDLSEELTAQNLPRYYSVLKKAELELKDKKVEDMAIMIEQQKLHTSVLERLSKEYEKGRKAPNDSFAKKVNLALEIADDEFIN
jgi:hypothetical protein